MSIDIYIINLKRSEKRKIDIMHKLDRLGVKASIFNAIDYMQDDFEQHVQQYDDSKRMRIYGNSLAPGEIACYASHYKMWEYCAKNNKPIVIMEDDVEIQKDFPTAIFEAEALIHEFKYIRLAATFKQPYLHIADVGSKFNLVRYIKGPQGMQCYALSPDGARMLLEKSQKWIMAVDHYIDMSWLHKLPAYALHPLVVSNGSFPSDCGSKEQNKLGIVQKLKRESFSGYRKIRNKIFNYQIKVKESRSIKD